jgi:hypothetical protein
MGLFHTPPPATEVLIGMSPPVALLIRRKAPYCSVKACDALSEMPVDRLDTFGTKGCS